MDTTLGGAFAFGLLIGWYAYYINRYRKGEVQIGDITTLVGAIGGGALLALFKGEDAKVSLQMFGAYGIGLAVGFFGYFLLLVLLVRKSNAFNSDWFLDGRRINPRSNEGYGTDAGGTVHPMSTPPVTHRLLIQAIPTAGPSTLSLAIADINAKAQQVIDACTEAYPDNQNACNYFAIAVAKQIGITPLTGRADDIVDQIRGADWTPLADGPAASAAAAAGKFVMAGMKSGKFSQQPTTEGHVAIVVVGPMNPGGWAPAGYWGSTSPDVAAKGGQGLPISWCFRSADQASITYACKDF